MKLGGAVSVGATLSVEDKRGAYQIQKFLLLGSGETVIHSGRDRSEAGCGQVGNHVLDRRWKHQSQYVSGLQARGTQTGGDLIGQPVGLGV